MNSKRLYYVLLGAIGLLVVGLIGGAYGVDKLLSSETTQLVGDRREVAVLREEQTQLNEANAEIKKYQSLADIAKSVVPQDKDQAQAIRQIVDIANANGVALSSISFPSSTLGTLQTTAGVQLSQLTPVPGIKGVYVLSLTIQSDIASPVPYNQFVSFLSDLEDNRRTALATQINITPNAKDRTTVSFNLVLDEYIKP